jgi:hypothetical protein
VNYHRGLLFWGLALITGGAVALGAQQGYIDSHVLAGTWRVWPLILIAIGVSILAARTPFAMVGTIVAALVVGAAGGALIAVGPGVAACGGPDPTSVTTRHGSFGHAASVKLEFNCGTLDVSMQGGTDWTIATNRQGDSAPQISADLTSLNARSTGSSNWFDSLGRQRWTVSLPRATNYQLAISPNAATARVNLRGGSFGSLTVQPNAGSLFLDLTAAKVADLQMSLNAGSASILVANGADVTGSLSVNAGSIELCATGAVALRLTVKENLTFSHNLQESGFSHDGDTWSYSPPVPSGVVVSSIDLHIEGNAGSFTLNPKGGCS